MSKFLLTIAIPTYNRPVQLAHTLSIIVPQVLSHENVQLLILDNCSPIPAHDVLMKVLTNLHQEVPERIRCTRHAHNIGGDPNILRCFEVAEGDWLWCLGDDDLPAHDAIETIISDIESGDDFCYGYYGLNENVPDLHDCLTGRYISSSIEEWVSRIPSYGHRLFISESIFNLKVVLPNLQMAYKVMPAGCAHLVMAYLAVLSGKNYLLSRKQIARYQSPVNGTGYNCVPFAYGSFNLFSLVRDVCGQRTHDKFFFCAIHRWLSPYLLLHQLILWHKGCGVLFLRHRFKSISDLFKPGFFVDPRLWLRWTLCDCFVNLPSLYECLISKRYSR